KAAADAAARAKEVVANTVGSAKETVRGIAAEPPAPSAASVEHAQKAAADAARNAMPPTAKKAPKKEGGVFAGFGASAAAGTDAGMGAQASAGFWSAPRER